jgi:hypothetical protein
MTDQVEDKVKTYDPPKNIGAPQLRTHCAVIEVKPKTRQVREVAFGVVKLRLNV